MAVIAETQCGPIRGREKDDVLLFAGIPFAAPPVAERRFRAAQPHDAWSDVRDARKFGPAAPQIADSVGEGLAPQHIADAVHGTWRRFIREGDPGFPAYSTEHRETMVFDDESGVTADPDGEERVAWDGLR